MPSYLKLEHYHYVKNFAIPSSALIFQKCDRGTCLFTLRILLSRYVESNHAS